MWSAPAAIFGMLNLNLVGQNNYEHEVGPCAVLSFPTLPLLTNLLSGLQMPVI